MSDDGAFQRAKRLLVAAAFAIAAGLALSASVAPRLGGVALVGGWLVAIGALHRLGRAGSESRS